MSQCKIRNQEIHRDYILRLHALFEWFIFDGRVKTKLAMLAFLYCEEFVKNSIIRFVETPFLLPLIPTLSSLGTRIANRPVASVSSHAHSFSYTNILYVFNYLIVDDYLKCQLYLAKSELDYLCI